MVVGNINNRKVLYILGGKGGTKMVHTCRGFNNFFKKTVHSFDVDIFVSCIIDLCIKQNIIESFQIVNIYCEFEVQEASKLLRQCVCYVNTLN